MRADLLDEIQRAVAVLGAGTAASEQHTPEPLDELFETLHNADEASKHAEAEDLIWALWCAHEDETARGTLNQAIGAIARDDLDHAQMLLDDLVVTWPDWAEAWNKRATLYFLRHLFLESVRDIRRTLEIEPRHFGALSGLGQICLQTGDEHSALIAFDFALHANPTLHGIRDAVETLRARVQRTLH